MALRSAVLARRLGLRFWAWPAAELVLELAGAEAASVCVFIDSVGGGRDRVWTWDGEIGVEGPLDPSAEDWGDWGAGEEEGEAAGMDIAIVQGVCGLGKEYNDKGEGA